MALEDLTVRLGVLEEKVEKLEDLPAHVAALELQVLQLRSEMRVEFSTVRSEMRSLNDRTLTQMRVLHEEVIDRIARIGEGPNG